MEAELAALVTSGATTAVGLMVTDSWQQAKERLVRLFARGGDAATVDGELDRSQDALAAAAGTPDEEILASDIAAMLRLRLRVLLQDHPGAATELRGLVEEFTRDAAPDATGSVHNSISGGTVHGPVLQGRSFSNVTFHNPGGGAPLQSEPGNAPRPIAE